MATYTVRPARAADLPSIIRLTELWAGEPSTTGHYPVNFADELQKRVGPYFWIAEKDGELIGFILGEVRDDWTSGLDYQVLRQGERYLNLDQLYVHPDHRGRGVGSELVTRLFAEAAAQGVHRHLVMSANAAADWERTIHFYRKHGFRPWYFRMFTGESTEERREDADGPS